MDNIDAGNLGTSAVIATALIPIVSLVKNPSWGRKAKYTLGMVAAFIAAVLGAVVDGGLEGGWQEIVARLAASLATASTIYNLYFENTTLNDKLEQSGNVSATN